MVLLYCCIRVTLCVCIPSTQDKNMHQYQIIPGIYVHVAEFFAVVSTAVLPFLSRVSLLNVGSTCGWATRFLFEQAPEKMIPMVLLMPV